MLWDLLPKHKPSPPFLCLADRTLFLEFQPHLLSHPQLQCRGSPDPLCPKAPNGMGVWRDFTNPRAWTSPPLVAIIARLSGPRMPTHSLVPTKVSSVIKKAKSLP